MTKQGEIDPYGEKKVYHGREYREHLKGKKGGSFMCSADRDKGQWNTMFENGQIFRMIRVADGYCKAYTFT
jgi:hypothetical protein